MDWDNVRDAYVKGDASLPEIAREYGVNTRTLSNRSANEAWGRQREEWRSKNGKGAGVGGVARARQVDFAVLQGVERDLEQTLVQAVHELSGQLHAGDLYRGWGREMADIAQALQACIRAKRDMGDAPDQAERARQEIARAKVQVDRDRNKLQAKRDERAAAAEGKASGSIHITVTGVEGSDDLGG